MSLRGRSIAPVEPTGHGPGRRSPYGVSRAASSTERELKTVDANLWPGLFALPRSDSPQNARLCCCGRSGVPASFQPGARRARAVAVLRRGSKAERRPRIVLLQVRRTRTTATERRSLRSFMPCPPPPLCARSLRDPDAAPAPELEETVGVAERDDGDPIEPSLHPRSIAPTCRSTSVSQGTAFATSSSRTYAVAASKLTGLGSSDCTFHPGMPNLNRSRATRLARPSSSSTDTASWPYLGLPGPAASPNACTSSRRGSVAIIPSPARAASAIDSGPLAAT